MKRNKKSGVNHHEDAADLPDGKPNDSEDYSMKQSKKKEKAICTMWYMGRDRVAVLHYKIVFGKTYAEICFPDGRRHTVPGDELYNEQREVVRE